MSKHPNIVNAKAMKDLLREHLKAGRSISNVEAQALWRCRALPKRISELRKDGMSISSEWCVDSTGQRYVRYRWDDFDAG